MAVQVISVVEPFKSVRYDGTNGADLVAAIDGASLTSDSGGLLRFKIGMWDYELPSGQWIVWRSSGGSTEVYGLLDNAAYEQRYTPLTA